MFYIFENIKDEDIVHANMKILDYMRETVWSLSTKSEKN